MSRAEVDLQISVKKACNNEEVPPKRKHVRACIVYTWDHKNSRAFWNAVKIQPLQSNEVQLFKALIMIHKVLQEGHPNTLKDGFRNRDFLYSLSTVFPSTSSYGLLINQYDRFLLQKLDFHRSNPGFNGTFEYEEYISLRTVNDPNEGYESILHLMDLQDLISDFQKQIFATIHQSPNNLCKVSALVPFISESYGIYKFLVSMLRAMFQQLGDDDALSALVDRFCSQHFNLREFYADCVSIKFLTSLINIPRIATEIPDLRISDTSERYAGPVEGSNDNVNENANANENASANANGVSLPSGNIQENSVLPPGTNLSNNHGLQAVDQTQQLAQQQLQLDAERQNYLQEQIQKQQLFELQMKAQEQKMLQEQQVLRQQQTSANQSRVAELERDLLMFKAQFDHDQEMLVQYDSRVKSMESELQNFNQIAAQQLLQKDEGLKNANEQIDSWAKKYETLAKLYSQLRSEHLNLLAKFKKIQQKISSAQESIMKKEKYEKELKTKNLELAEIIRERDRARMELDRMKVANDSRLEQLSFELKEARSLVSDAAKSNSVAFSTALEKCNDEILHLKSKLQEKEHQVVSSKELINVKESLKAKELDLEVTQESLNEALRQLAISRDLPSVFKFVDVFDVILANSVRRIQDSKYDLISPMQAGNALATPEYLLSLFELCSDTATSFSVALNDVIAEGDEAVDHSVYTQAILSGSELTSILNNLMLNSKGLSKTISPDEGELLVSHTTNVLSGAELFFSSLTTDSMENFPTEDEKIDFVIDCNLSFQHLLQTSSSFIDTLSSKHKLGGIDRTNIADAVGDKFSQTAKAVEEASSFLSTLLASASKTETLEVHESILSLALEITEAVSKLITAATETQAEIVSVNKGTISRGEFYRKNSRWTEGLISASMAVAGATNILIKTADGVIKDENLHEQLIVACNEVAASTAQLVAASRVKAPANFRTCEGLESSSKTVNTACKRLVTQVQRMIKTDRPVEDPVNLHGLTTYEGKTLEMEQQVEILKLENLLSSAREKLAQIRKHGYADNISDDEL